MEFWHFGTTMEKAISQVAYEKGHLAQIKHTGLLKRTKVEAKLCTGEGSVWRLYWRKFTLLLWLTEKLNWKLETNMGHISLKKILRDFLHNMTKSIMAFYCFDLCPDFHTFFELLIFYLSFPPGFFLVLSPHPGLLLIWSFPETDFELPLLPICNVSFDFVCSTDSQPHSAHFLTTRLFPNRTHALALPKICSLHYTNFKNHF